jgi:TPR repeat protein
MVPLSASAQEQPQAAPRIAMVVGNSNYVSVSALPNPANDAHAVAEKLWESGFEVIETIDADREKMLADLATFRSRLREGSEALFFYAGHGVQINGRNYLIPVSASPASVADLTAQSIDAQLFVDIMANSGAKLNLVMLDACRNNPFTEITQAETSVIETRALSIGASKQEVARGLEALAGASTGGLAEMTAGDTETMISFATAPGSVAFDGVGQHSPYTQALVDNIDEPGLELSELFRRVRGDVRETTDGDQIAWTTSTLESRFYFKPEGGNLRETTTGMTAASDTLGGLPPRRILDRTFWRAIRETDRPDAFAAYLRTMPDGTFADEARQKLRDLGVDAKTLLPDDPLFAPAISRELNAIDLANQKQLAASLDLGDVAVAIGTDVVPLNDGTTEAGWVYVKEPPRLGEVTAQKDAPAPETAVRWVPQGQTLLYQPFVGSNGGVDKYEGLSLRNDGTVAETQVAVQTYIDACDMLAGNPYDGERVTAGTRQFIIDRNFDAAIAVCEIAVENNPDVVRFWAQLARAYRSAGRYEDALVYQQRAVDAGYASAMVYLGQMYLDGQAVPQDFGRAKELFEDALLRGETAAYTALAWIYRAGVGVTEDNETALQFYRDGAQRGNDWAMTNVAEFYQKGLGVAPDMNEALRWYIAAAKSGELTAQTRLARIYQIGDGVERDFASARFWFEAAAGRGVPNALTRLGLMYEQGQGTEKDIEAAARLYTDAARAGDAEAYFRLGKLYASSHPLYDDPARAAALLQRAFAENVYGADRELARLFEAGRGVEKNIAEARRLYVSAAEGNPWAARDAGRVWASSDGVSPDMEQAVRWYRIAAEGGVPWAALDLGKLAQVGRGVAQDRIQALIWFARALGLSDDPNLAKAVAGATGAYSQKEINTAVQVMLIELGQDIGIADGQIGPATRGALEAAFDARDKAAPNGDINLNLLAQLTILKE